MEENLVEITEGNIQKKQPKWILVGIAVLIIAVLIPLGIFIKNKMELNLVREQTEQLLEEIKAGYIEESDFDVPTELYAYLTKDWNDTVKKVVEYGLGGEEEWSRGWTSVLACMEYTVDSVEKIDGVYQVTVTVSNKDITLIMTGVASKLWGSKIAFASGILTGTTADQFWDAFEYKRDEINTVVSGTYLIEISKDKDVWQVTYAPQMIGTMAGMDEKYIEAITDERKTITIDREK
jgi:hypothetical protein